MSRQPPSGRDWLHDGRLQVITLPGARDRQRRILEWGEELGIGAEIFQLGTAPPAPGSALPAANPLTLARYGRGGLQPGEIGCLASHRQLYRRLVEKDQPWALVLEDDVAPCRPDWPALVEGLIRRVERSRLADLAWVCHLGLSPGVLRLLALRPLCWQRQESDAAAGAGIGQLDPSIGAIWTTHAYLISRRAARGILEREPEATYVADDWDQRLRSGILHPMLATLHPLFLPDPLLPSQIGARSDFRTPIDQRQHGPASFLYRLNRKTRTLIYRAGLRPVHY